MIVDRCYYLHCSYSSIYSKVLDNDPHWINKTNAMPNTEAFRQVTSHLDPVPLLQGFVVSKYKNISDLICLQGSLKWSIWESSFVIDLWQFLFVCVTFTCKIVHGIKRWLLDLVVMAFLRHMIREEPAFSLRFNTKYENIVSYPWLRNHTHIIHTHTSSAALERSRSLHT